MVIPQLKLRVAERISSTRQRLYPVNAQIVPVPKQMPGSPTMENSGLSRSWSALRGADCGVTSGNFGFSWDGLNTVLFALGT
jgi:hypothetical protein